MKSYVQRFNAESLKIDVPDEKFAITAFIAGLGVQSKDLMFSISKNPQASMAEVLAKAEKYIKRARRPSYQRRRAPPPSKRKGRQTDDEGGAPRDKTTRGNPQAQDGSDPLKGEGVSGTVWAHRKPKDDDITRLNASLH